MDRLEKRLDLTPAKYADFIETWIARGAVIVGGCCDVGTTQTREIARRVKKDNG